MDYQYDHSGQRVLKNNGTTTTHYPSSLYEVKGATTTKHIYANDTLVATVEEDTPASVVYHNHLDHLNSTNVVTGDDGYINHLLAYYPFGALRMDKVYGDYDETKKYTGHEYDEETELTYAGARYYNQNIGKWLSQDPAYINMDRLNIQVRDPQSWNSYSYARNNPMILTDPTGEFWWYGFYDWSGYDGMRGVAMKAGEVLGGRARALETIQNNQLTIQNAANQHDISSQLIRSIIYEEQSHLKPDEVVGREQLFPNIGSGGVGVMQVSGSVGSEYGGHTKTQLAWSPSKNINAGSAYLSYLTNGNGGVAAYNGQGIDAQNYEKRVNAQMTNPNYHKNIFKSQLQQLANSLKEFSNKLRIW